MEPGGSEICPAIRGSHRCTSCQSTVAYTPRAGRGSGRAGHGGCRGRASRSGTGAIRRTQRLTFHASLFDGTVTRLAARRARSAVHGERMSSDLNPHAGREPLAALRLRRTPGNLRVAARYVLCLPSDPGAARTAYRLMHLRSVRAALVTPDPVL